MERIPGSMVRTDGRIPKLLRYVHLDEIENNIMRVEKNYDNQCGKELNSVVKLHTPYGQQFHVQYSKKELCFTNFGKIYRDFEIREKGVIVLCYMGAGNFLINVFNKSYTEYDYNSLRQRPRDIVNLKERITGVGWNFLSLSIGLMQTHGGAVIPETFQEMFCRQIPKVVSIILNNGDVLPGKLSLVDKRIYGLAPLYRKQFVKMFDILMFTYCGSGRFELSVFGKTKMERLFELPEISSDSTDSENESENDEEIEELAEDEVVQNINVNGAGFEVVMTTSNVDNKCHGAYIPRNITPTNRNWMKGDKIILQTGRGSWRVGLVLSNDSSRISAGWNKFVRDNDIELNNRLRFTLLGNIQGIWTFTVQIQ